MTATHPGNLETTWLQSTTYNDNVESPSFLAHTNSVQAFQTGI
jgi:hypothetical protein